MKQYPSSTIHHVNNEDDEDDERKPPAKKILHIPPLTRHTKKQKQSPNGNENNHNNEEQHSESGVYSHASSTAVASIDHSSFHETSSIAARTGNNSRSWWNTLSPFRSSSNQPNYDAATLNYTQAEKLQQQTLYTNTDDYIYHTPTNTSMINAIRNEMSHERSNHHRHVPDLTFATPYTPDDDHYRNHAATTNTTSGGIVNSRPVSSQPSTNMTTTESAALVVNPGGTATTTTPTSPVEEITNTTIVRIQQSTMLYLGSSTVAWVVLLSHLLPTVVIYTLLWIMMSTIAMIHIYYTTIERYYHHVVVMGPGLGSMLLPHSVYNLLTHESLHDFLTDEVMVLEYRHLLLYFLPISAQQLRDLLRRISPHHQQRLQRRGEIGTLIFGEPIMRIILGHTQFEQWRNRRLSSLSTSSLISNDANNIVNTNAVPRQIFSPSSVEQPLLPNSTLVVNYCSDDDDEHSDLGLDLSGDDMIGGNAALARRLGLVAPIPSIVINHHNNNNNNSIDTGSPRPLPNDVNITTSPVVISSNRVAALNNPDSAVRATTYDDQEYQVLMDALWESFYGVIFNPIIDYATTTYMIPTLQRISRISFHTGIVLLSVSTGNLFGLWGWSYHIISNNMRLFLSTVGRGLILSSSDQQSQNASSVIANPSRNGVVEPIGSSRSSPRSFGSFSRPSTMTWSTALLGSASLGISFYSRQYVRRYHMTMMGSNSNPNNNVSSSNAIPTPTSNNVSKLKLTESSIKKK